MDLKERMKFQIKSLALVNVILSFYPKSCVPMTTLCKNDTKLEIIFYHIECNQRNNDLYKFTLSSDSL